MTNNSKFNPELYQEMLQEEPAEYYDENVAKELLSDMFNF